MRTPLGALLLLSAACGSSNPPGQTSCGVGGVASGMECTGLDQCGAGASNYVKEAFCEHCFARGDSHVCEAGTCRALPTSITGLGTIGASFSILEYPAAKSFAQASLLPTTADGTKLTCAALLSTCNWVDNKTINGVLANFRVRPQGDAVLSLISVDPGSDRLYFVALTSDVQGKGNVLAHGCVEGITVAAGQTVMEAVELKGVP